MKKLGEADNMLKMAIVFRFSKLWNQQLTLICLINKTESVTLYNSDIK